MNAYSSQDIDLKISPDLDEYGVDAIIESSDFYVRNFTTTNTTTEHNPKFIPLSRGIGGASGKAVYERSLKVQKMFEDRIGNPSQGIIICGGIDSGQALVERLTNYVMGVQVFTPLIFKGPKLIRELRQILSVYNPEST